MNEIYKKVNEKTSGKFSALRFPKVTFPDNTHAVVTVVCKKEDRRLVDGNKFELTALLTEICGFTAQVSINIVDDDPTPANIRAAVVAFTERFSYVSSVLHTISAEIGTPCKVKMKMHGAMYELAKNDYVVRLNEFLKNNYAQEVIADIEIVDFAASGTTYSATVAAPTKEYAVRNCKPILGNLNVETAQSVSSLTANAYNVTVCGVFAMPTEFMSKGGRKYERFLLYDGETSLQCRYSPDSRGGIVSPELLSKKVCVFGNVEYESARNEASIYVREMCTCDVDGLTVTQPKPVPNKYERVIPQPYEEFVQSSMFEAASELPPALKGGFVVFDFETTGLSIVYDKPTELGAVRIEDGRITEYFSTLIDPRRPIPPEVSAKTGITDDMVKGQPLFEDVLPDFYKFSYGCSFVCHNISFDFPFLLKGGNRCGLAFGDRKTYDTMGIAPLAIPGISKLTLDKVLEGLGLTNENAHRAYHDAAATAKAFIAMHKILAQKK
ncbi:MAG: 3'-5' exonuclease [Clostridiales bacterium]|nr:3'-5' exonuclease [Clostridiales bacterium]